MAEAAGQVRLAKEPVLGQLFQNAFRVIEVQLILAIGPFGRVPRSAAF